MRSGLTICITTARPRPEVEWIFDSVCREFSGTVDLMVMDLNCEYPELKVHRGRPVRRYPVKPNIYQGKHRVTKDNHWAKSSALNAALCLLNSSWCLFLDDRGVLLPGFSTAIADAMKGGYAVCGSYQKRIGMRVDNGVITHGGIITGEDDRLKYVTENKSILPFKCPGSWFYGCVNLVPVDMMLKVNGWVEDYTNGMGFEDALTGMIMVNAGFDLRYDPRIRLIEDRSPEFVGTPLKRTAKERWPNDKEDKAHTMLKKVETMKTSGNSYDLRELRAKIQNGGQFPIPDSAIEYRDWFDNTLVKNL